MTIATPSPNGALELSTTDEKAVGAMFAKAEQAIMGYYNKEEAKKPLLELQMGERTFENVEAAGKVLQKRFHALFTGLPTDFKTLVRFTAGGKKYAMGNLKKNAESEKAKGENEFDPDATGEYVTAPVEGSLPVTEDLQI